MLLPRTLGRRLLFRHYWWAGLVLGIAGGVVVFRYGGGDRVTLIGAVIAGTLTKVAERAGPSTDDGRHIVVDYFNLCAEEYLFYKQGYIHCDAWRSCCRGMRWYLAKKPFRDIWDKEVETESFYGLPLAGIERCA